MNSYTIAILFVMCAMVGMVVVKVAALAALAVLGFAVVGGGYLAYKAISAFMSRRQ